jgi:molybdopterin molybdotransferase
MTEHPRTRLRPTDAAVAILNEMTPLPSEPVPLRLALGRVLAETVDAPFDLPQWDNSAMDGYAVRSADIKADEPTRLTIVEDIPAGAFPTRALGAGECARIFTGAPIPEAADCVIRQEDATRLDARTVQINDVRDVGRNVRRRGEDVHRGTAVLPSGTALRPAQIGVLASVACSEPIVHRRPRVAVLGTGDEVADLSERSAILAGRKIASSNTYTMLAMADAAGAETIDLGIVPDDPDAIRARLTDAAGADLLVTSGGMSVGEHDHLRSLLEEDGTELLFWRLRMRPGAPVGFGRYRGTPWIGLPGNPVSTMVTFELFVRPAIRKLMGYRQFFRRTTPARVGEHIVTHADLQHFLRVTLTMEDGTLTARTTGAQGSGILTSMVKADALLIVPEDRRQIAAGELLEVIRLDEPTHVATPPF